MNAASVLRHSAKHRDVAKRQRAFHAFKLTGAKYRVLGLHDNYARSTGMLAGAASNAKLVMLNEQQAQRLMQGEVV
jgi:hypothetical protein